MNYEEWNKWWQEKAPGYFTDKVWNFSRPDLIERLGITKDSHVLEIGFGYGREIFNFCKLSNNVFGVELTAFACQNAWQLLISRSVIGVPLLRMYNGLMLPFVGNSMDVIYSCFVIQHMSRDHAKTLIKSALSVIKPGGKILFEFFGDVAYYQNGKDVFSGIDGEGGMFNNAYVPEELGDIISDCGGKIEWISTDPITNVWNNYWVCFSKR